MYIEQLGFRVKVQRHDCILLTMKRIARIFRRPLTVC